MYKIHKFPFLLPPSICNTIAENSPTPGSSHETCAEWITEFDNTLYRNTIFYKGPLLFTEMANHDFSSTHTINALKNKIKKSLLNLQNLGDTDEWQPDNFKLYSVTGLRKSKRIENVITATYT